MDEAQHLIAHRFRAEPLNPDRKPATARQRQVYDLVVDAWLGGRSITVRELCDHLCIASTNCMFGHIEALRRKGWIANRDARQTGRSKQGTLRPRLATLDTRTASVHKDGAPCDSTT